MKGKQVVSLFSGVGGFEYGFEQAGYETVYQCEIDAKCRSVLRRHFPAAGQWDDIKTLTGKTVVDSLAARNAAADVVIWGSPCQDLSVAGLGGGLDGERSGLFYEGMRVIREIRKETNNEYPRVTVWENVPGALSSNKGADFGRVIDTMAEAGALVIEWRVLDARFFGVPQRRRRVFVVAVFDHTTAARCSEPLFPIAQSRKVASKSSGEEESEDVETAKNDLDGNSRTVFGFINNRFAQYVDSDVALAIRATGGDMGGGAETLVSYVGCLDSVRRLTPIECERLMGWADNWTLFGSDGKKIADSTRYQMCGNGVASPVARWVAEQVGKVL